MMPDLTLIAGCGYLGTVLARELLATGHAVLALTRQKASAEALGASGIPAVVCDLSEEASVASLRDWPSQMENAPEILGEFPLRIVHCAASGRGGRAEQYRSVYLDGCRNLRAAFPQASRFFFTSSTSVYPHIGGEWVTESSNAQPDRETGRILRETEEETLAAGGIVGRLAGIYGPGRSFLLKNFLAGQALIDVRTEPPATPNGRWVNQIHVRDAARAIIHLLERPGFPVKEPEIFNIADSTPLLQRPLYQRLSEKFGLPLPPEALPDLERKRGWTHTQVSNTRLLASGWKPLYPDWFAALEHDPAFLPSVTG
jgi:nucleoside-diphosphate-sugar epimerase